MVSKKLNLKKWLKRLLDTLVFITVGLIKIFGQSWSIFCQISAKNCKIGEIWLNSSLMSHQRRKNSWLTGGAYKDRPENIFLQKWTGQKILEGADWSSHTKTKQKRQNWTSHSYFWPVLISAGPCNAIRFFIII